MILKKLFLVISLFCIYQSYTGNIISCDSDDDSDLIYDTEEDVASDDTSSSTDIIYETDDDSDATATDSDEYATQNS
ncbi:hypothetical protein A3F66_06550 [candidate division TM6 bacterium RIFCSPHIGHO2_12_FULL_32_22]|nr:MAG: hypothetical protein A3F66_06550 [candidate division TM6 bacterium RIFCSPHIGHO2_12_FULL_32_22]